MDETTRDDSMQHDNKHDDPTPEQISEMMTKAALGRLASALQNGEPWAIKYTLGDRDSSGRFVTGNTASQKSPLPGYGWERQVQTGEISDALAHEIYGNVKRLEAGEARAMHAEQTAREVTVATGLQVVYEKAQADYFKESSEANWRRLDSVLKHMYTWTHGASNNLQWEAEHPDGDGKTLDYEAMIAKGKGDGNTAD